MICLNGKKELSHMENVKQNQIQIVKNKKSNSLKFCIS